MSKKIWVFRCLDGCQGLQGSWDRHKVIKEKALHKETHGHRGEVKLEDQIVIESCQES
jgi:hypothetical protein